MQLTACFSVAIIRQMSEPVLVKFNFQGDLNVLMHFNQIKSHRLFYLDSYSTLVKTVFFTYFAL